MIVHSMIIQFYVQHSDASSAHSPLLVSFVGDGGVLASAAVGEDTVDIWDPPPTDSDSSKAVMKPTSRITVDDQNIVRYIILYRIAYVEKLDACRHVCTFHVQFNRIEGSN